MFFSLGAILFNIHSDDLCDELTALLVELNKNKIALWKQMHIIEIIAAELADCLSPGGTKFEMEPERILWPDGTITKKNNPTTRSRKKKAHPAASKHGLYGVIVAQYSNPKKNPTPSASTSATPETSVSIIVERPDAESNAAAAPAPKAKQVRRGTFSVFSQCFYFTLIHSKY